VTGHEFRVSVWRKWKLGSGAEAKRLWGSMSDPAMAAVV
jgi:hypothetical protein